MVISADDLRLSGVNISRCLSWEKTALDLVWEMANNPWMLPLSNCSNLVVRFGLEGAIHCSRKGGKIPSRLYFDPSTIENGFRDKYPGDMQGLSSAFTAALAARIASRSEDGDEKELAEAAVGPTFAKPAGQRLAATTSPTFASAALAFAFSGFCSYFPLYSFTIYMNCHKL